MTPARIADTVNNGSLRIDIRKYADGRFGFDFTPPAGVVKKRRHKNLNDAKKDALEKLGATQAGKIDLLTIDPKEFAEFLRWKSNRRKAVEIRALVDSFLESLESRDRSPKYRRSMAATLGDFADEFPGHLDAIQRDRVEKWLGKKKVGPRRFNNILSEVKALYSHARKHGHIGADILPVEMIGKKAAPVKIQTYSPDEFREMLGKCPRAWIPHLILGAFCGLRPEETCPEHRSHKTGLEWGHILWDKGLVEVPADVAKGRKGAKVRRFAPLTNAARAFLEPWRRSGATGAVTPNTRWDVALAKFKEEEGITWRPDALRHSFASYRLALEKNLGALRLEMGNSEAMLRQHYLDIQHEDCALEWFAIRPDFLDGTRFAYERVPWRADELIEWLK